MKLSALIAPLIAAKVSHELILEQILAFESEQDNALELRRATDAARQARKREREKSRDVTVRTSDRPLTGERDAPVEDNSLTQKIEPQEKQKERRRATRLAPEWKLPAEWRQDALSAELPEWRIDAEAAKFLDWSLSSKNGAKLDWRAAWRNWCRRAVTDQPRAGPPVKKPHLSEVYAFREKLENEQARQAPEASILYLPAASG